MFRSAPVLRVCPESDQWVLELPLVWESDGEIIVVPPGFRTDLASIPRLAQSIVPVNGRHRAAAILHDYLFVIQDRPRADVDRLFLVAMQASGVRLTQRLLMWAAVRVGGWLPWQLNAHSRATDLRGFLQSHGLEVRHAAA